MDSMDLHDNLERLDPGIAGTHGRTRRQVCLSQGKMGRKADGPKPPLFAMVCAVASDKATGRLDQRGRHLLRATFDSDAEIAAYEEKLA